MDHESLHDSCRLAKNTPVYPLSGLMCCLTRLTFAAVTAACAHVPCLGTRMSRRWTTGLCTTVAANVFQPEPLVHAFHLTIVGISLSQG